MGNSLSFELVFPSWFLSGCIQDFLSLVFRSLVRMLYFTTDPSLGMDFFGFILIQEFAQLLKSVCLWLLLNLGSYQSSFLWILFQPHPISPLLLGLWWYRCWIFCCFTGPWGSVRFFQPVFSLLFRLSEFYLFLSSSPWILFSFISTLLLSPSCEFLLLLFYFPVI